MGQPLTFKTVTKKHNTMLHIMNKNALTMPKRTLAIVILFVATVVLAGDKRTKEFLAPVRPGKSQNRLIDMEDNHLIVGKNEKIAEPEGLFTANVAKEEKATAQFCHGAIGGPTCGRQVPVSLRDNPPHEWRCPHCEKLHKR